MSQVANKPQSKVSVEILGERYTIKGDADPGYIAEVANLVDGRMRELNEAGKKSSSTNRSRLAVLTAINLADELLQARIDNSDRLENDTALEFQERTHQLISLLDEGLIGDSDLS